MTKTKTPSPAALSGFCNPSNPPDSHDRCRKANCPCTCHIRVEEEPAFEGADLPIPSGITVVYVRHGDDGFSSGWSCLEDAERFASWLTDCGAAIDVEVMEL